MKITLALFLLGIFLGGVIGALTYLLIRKIIKRIENKAYTKAKLERNNDFGGYR